MSDSFASWLAAAHPDVRLTAAQLRWVRAMEHGQWPVWLGGRRSGRTFIRNLWQEYLDVSP